MHCVVALVVVSALLAAQVFASHRIADSDLAGNTITAYPRIVKKLSARAQRELGGAKISCGECRMVIAILESLSANKTQWNSTLEFVEEICDAKFANDTTKKKECAIVIDLARVLIPKIFKGLESLAWDIPRTFCADIVKACTEPCCSTATVPEQIHLAFANGSDPISSMLVAWTTLQATPGAVVQYWPANAATQVASLPEEPTRTYTAGGWVGVLHSAVMTGLQPAMRYGYRVGSNATGWSNEFHFSTLPADVGRRESRPLRVIAIADMGYGPNSNNTINSIASLVQKGLVDVVLHYGDISYADGDEQHWDVFWNKVQPIAAHVPYMTTPGNHELWWNFTAYKARAGWMMPRAGGNTPDDAMYYSLNLGTVTIAMLNSETWIDTPNIDDTQVAWLGEKVAAANAVRSTKRPWLLAVHHRPLYCTSTPGFDCDGFATILRGQVEALYNEAKVDIGLAGHMHNYERTYPVSSGILVGKNYTNPVAPIYVVNGAAGNREGNDMPRLNMPWSVTGHQNVGFMRLDFTSKFSTSTHRLRARFVDSRTMAVLDEFTITKQW